MTNIIKTIYRHIPTIVLIPVITSFAYMYIAINTGYTTRSEIMTLFSITFGLAVILFAWKYITTALQRSWLLDKDNITLSKFMTAITKVIMGITAVILSSSVISNLYNNGIISEGTMLFTTGVVLFSGIVLTIAYGIGFDGFTKFKEYGNNNTNEYNRQN